MPNDLLQAEGGAPTAVGKTLPPSARSPQLSALFDAATGGDDLLACRRAPLQAAHRHRLLQTAVGEQLDLAMIAPDEPRFRERLRRHRTVHLREIVETNHLGVDAEWVGEAALRQAARDRHLAALERGLAT